MDFSANLFVVAPHDPLIVNTVNTKANNKMNKKKKKSSKIFNQ